MYVISAGQDSVPSIVDRTDGFRVCGNSKRNEFIGLRDRNCPANALSVSVNCAFTDNDLHTTVSCARVSQFAFRRSSV